MKLHDPIAEHFRLTKTHTNALKKLGLETVEDLLLHFPARYDSVSDVKPIANLGIGETVVIYGRLTKLQAKKLWKSRRPATEGYVEDATGKLKIIWFAQPYIAKMHPEGSYVKLTGKITGNEKSKYLASPKVEPAIEPESTEILTEQKSDGAIHPVYPEVRGITSRWFYHAVQRIFEHGVLESIAEPLPKTILEEYNLPLRDAAFQFIHTPKKESDAVAARKRFAFEEVLYIQIAQQMRRRSYEKKLAHAANLDLEKVQEFIDRFPFDPTNAQTDAINTILQDISEDHPMTRLLEGDVGSGKTAVAAATVYAVATTRPGKQDYGNLQTAYMVPTEILAKQQFENFITFFEHLPIQIGLITSSGCKKFPSKVDPTQATDISRAQLLKWVANGEIPILIGTHSLIQKTVQFENLAYVIIDEQHRFGTIQRKSLVRKDDVVPHLLSMTATPIPRTLALTIYGDLDLTLLNEMPRGRKPIITKAVSPKGRVGIYEEIRKELESGRQAYVICPRIDEPDPNKALAIQAKSVKEECTRLSKDVFPEFNVEVLHGKMKPSEKEETMKRFEDGEIDILVATSVVEVGVNVPNATVIIIEGADRFGLAQLHQLRGRVIRSNHQAYCYVFAESQGPQTKARLKALTTAKNGFELAEEDLKIRGPGELAGRGQSGITDIGMEAIRNLKMVEAARDQASNILEKDPELKKLSHVKHIVETKAKHLHFE